MKVQVMANGQISIPPEVLQRLGVQVGDELWFSLTGDEVHLRPVKRRRLSEFRGALPATVPYPGKGIIRQHVGEALALDDQES